MYLKKYLALLLLTAGTLCGAVNNTPEFVSYEKFGAKGNGKTDDQLAIAAAHDFANSAGLPVRAGRSSRQSKPGR